MSHAHLYVIFQRSEVTWLSMRTESYMFITVFVLIWKLLRKKNNNNSYNSSYSTFIRVFLFLNFFLFRNHITGRNNKDKSLLVCPCLIIIFSSMLWNVLFLAFNLLGCHFWFTSMLKNNGNFSIFVLKIVSYFYWLASSKSWIMLYDHIVSICRFTYY